jgi:hypothetical protein
MADVFSPTKEDWTYAARASDALRTTQLPIPAERFVAALGANRCTLHDAAYWEAEMKGQDFRTEDHLDTNAFNAALWRGLADGPQPEARSGEDLRSARAKRIEDAPRGRCLT